MASDFSESQSAPEDTPTPADSPAHVSAWSTADANLSPPLSDGSARPPGPGLPESIFWLFGVLALQAFGLLAATAAVLVAHTFTLPPEAQAALLDSIRDPQVFESIQVANRVPILVVSQTFFLLSVIVLVRLRLGRESSRRLSFAPIPWRHVVLMLLLLLPTMVISNETYAMAKPAWEHLLERVPELKALDDTNTMTMIPDLANQISLPLLLFAIAIVPAIAEELVFRGVVGRGLTARWGLLPGVVLTSILFACAHVHPLHALGVLPLGIIMHFVYLATRSILAPMLFHFLNNGIAVVALKLQQPVGGEELVGHDFPLVRGVLAVAAVFAIGLLMWHIRVRYIWPDGRVWDPGHQSVERPPAIVPVFQNCRPATQWLVGVAAVCVLAFFSTFVSIGKL